MHNACFTDKTSLPQLPNAFRGQVPQLQGQKAHYTLGSKSISVCSTWELQTPNASSPDIHSTRGRHCQGSGLYGPQRARYVTTSFLSILQRQKVDLAGEKRRIKRQQAKLLSPCACYGPGRVGVRSGWPQNHSIWELRNGNPELQKSNLLASAQVNILSKQNQIFKRQRPFQSSCRHVLRGV